MKYSVQFEIDVIAETPEQAATIARDILLDPDSKVNADIYPYEYIEEAEDWFPCGEHGWFAYFGGGVQPDGDLIEWVKHEN